MPMLAAVTCLARRRRMHCRGSDPAAAAALELDQRQCCSSDQRHRWQAEPAPSGLHALSSSPPHDQRRRGGAVASSGMQGRRRRLPQDGAQDTRRRRHQAVPGPGSSAATVLKKAPAAGVDARAGAENTGAPAPPSSPVLCAVCLEDVRGQGDAAAAATLPCSHSYHLGCVLPWLAAHGACPCCRATTPSPED